MFFKTQYHLDMIDTSSKMNLKLSCLKACENNVERARELYDFLMTDVSNIPDVEPVAPGAFEKVKQSAADLFGWLSSHRDELAEGVSFIQSLKTTNVVPKTDVPPIPKI